MAVRPTFMGFETATRGLMSGQKALDIVANNLTNIGVTGYTRQRTDQVSMSINMRYTRYNLNSTAFAGQGVNIYGVSQIRDSFLDKRFREEYADVGYYTVTASVLGDMADVLDETYPATMSQAMLSFQEAWNALLANNDEKTNSANVLAKATNIVQILNQMSAKLDNIWNQQQYTLEQDVKNINTILQQIALLNETIAQERYNCMDVGNELYQPLELLDQRNVLLDQLSEYADISYQEDEKGMVTVKMGGYTAVEGKEYQRLSTQVDSSDPEFKTMRVFWNGSGDDVRFTSGSIIASLDMLNGRGVYGSPNNGESFTEGILYYKDQIDRLAVAIGDEFNHCVEILDTVTDPDNPQPYDPPVYKELFTFDPMKRNSAATIGINEHWTADSTYLLQDVAWKIEEGNESNSYAAKGYNLFEKEINFGDFKGTFNDFITYYSTTKLGNSQELAQSQLESVSSVADSLLDQIQQISGVSMDEEGVDMMMYQRAYDAVSRVFTTLDEMLDKLINGTGVVGR